MTKYSKGIWLNRLTDYIEYQCRNNTHIQYIEVMFRRLMHLSVSTMAI